MHLQSVSPTHSHVYFFKVFALPPPFFYLFKCICVLLSQCAFHKKILFFSWIFIHHLCGIANQWGTGTKQASIQCGYCKLIMNGYYNWNGKLIPRVGVLDDGGFHNHRWWCCNTLLPLVSCADGPEVCWHKQPNPAVGPLPELEPAHHGGVLQTRRRRERPPPSHILSLW